MRGKKHSTFNIQHSTSKDLLSEPEAASQASDPGPRASEIPSLLQYVPMAGSELWRVEKFREMAAEFQFVTGAIFEEQMAAFHELIQGQTRQWDFLRRLYGINPLLIPEGAVLDDLTVLTRAELCEQRGLVDKELQAELDVVRGLWAQLAQRFQAQNSQQPTSNSDKSRAGIQRPKAELQGEFRDDPARVLKEFGFSEKMFEEVMLFDPREDITVNASQLVKRSMEKNNEERAWFASRVEECRVMLLEPSAKMLVRDALFNELHLMRIQDEMSSMTPGMREYDKLDKRKGDLEKRFQTQMEKLEKNFPDMNTANKMSYRQHFANVFGAEQDFYGDGNNKRRTFLFTAAELQVATRQSLQNPQPQYRLSTELLALEATHGLYDRSFRSALAHRPNFLKRCDAIGRAMLNAVREGLGEKLVDLENGVTPDEGDNFEDLVEVKE